MPQMVCVRYGQRVQPRSNAAGVVVRWQWKGVRQETVGGARAGRSVRKRFRVPKEVAVCGGAGSLSPNLEVAQG